jgi:hypothetical protein
MRGRELVLDLALNWSRPWELSCSLWTGTYLIGSVGIPISNPAARQENPSWFWPDTVFGRSHLSIPSHFDLTLELVRVRGGTQVYRYVSLRKKPLVFFDGISISGRLSWLGKEIEGLEPFLAQIPEEAVRIWNQKIVESKERAQELDLGRDRKAFLLVIPFLLPIEIGLDQGKVVLLFRGQKFPEGQDPVAFALEVAPELALFLA